MCRHITLAKNCRRFTLEGLEYGWRKSIKQYHYHSTKDDFISLCGVSSYARIKSEFKEIQFLTDIEITPDMKVCPDCYSARQNQIREKIITVHKKSVGFWDNSCVCPECKTGIIFWNSSKSKEHPCTVCDKMVVFV